MLICVNLPVMELMRNDASLPVERTAANRKCFLGSTVSPPGSPSEMYISVGDAKLVLLCPAWKKFGTTRTVKPGTVILHSRADDVVPFVDSEELVKNSGLSVSALIEVGNDHRLADPEPLEAMLKACH